jgi:hypothetical protein
VRYQDTLREDVAVYDAQLSAHVLGQRSVIAHLVQVTLCAKSTAQVQMSEISCSCGFGESAHCTESWTTYSAERQVSHAVESFGVGVGPSVKQHTGVLACHSEEFICSVVSANEEGT